MDHKNSFNNIAHHKSTTMHKSLVSKSTLQTNSLVVSMEPELARVGDYFPAKLAVSFGMAHFLCGLLVLAFSALSMVLEAGMSNIGAGLWAGTVIVVSGILGIMAGKRPKCALYLVAFLCLAIISLAVSGLLVVFSTMGLIQDQNHPRGFYVDDQGNKIEFLGTVPMKSPAIAMNTVLIVLGTLSMLLAIGSILICGREACQCYVLESQNTDDGVPVVESMIRRHRVMTWLGEQEVNNGLSLVDNKNDFRVHPIVTGAIPRIPDNLGKKSKRNLSPTSSSSTMKTELESDTVGDCFAKRHFVSSSEIRPSAKAKTPNPDY